ncbi:MAG: outer membrane protein transport protein [Thiotrichaceae bacterium]
MNVKCLSRVGLLSLAAMYSTSIMATNGIFLIGYGAKSRAMGGVGIGYTQDGLGNQMNPAGITSVEVGANGWRFDIDAMLFVPKRSVELPDPRDPPNAGNPIRYRSGQNLFLIPAMAATYKVSDKLYYAASFVGAGGGGTDYLRLSPLGVNFFNPAKRAGVSRHLGVRYNQAQIAFTAAYKVTPKHSVAVSPIIGIQLFRAEGLGLFQPFSSDTDKLTNNGADFAFGYGVRIGWQGEINKWLSLGATLQSKVYFSKFDKYTGLLAEGGRIDAPANIGVGVVIRPHEKITVAFDFQRVMYSAVRAINNPIERLSEISGFLGEKSGAGFGWEDQDIYKLGVKYHYNKEWDFSAGFNYGESPIPKDQLLFSALAPAVTEKHITLGASYRPDEIMEWTVAYVHAINNTQRGLAQSDGQFDTFFPNSDLTGPGEIELQMFQDSLELSFAYKF